MKGEQKPVYKGGRPQILSQREARRRQGIMGSITQTVNNAPQLSLSRRTRRALERKARRASQDARVAAAGLPTASSDETKAAYVDMTPTDPGFGAWTLKSLREEAQRKGIRVDGKRPSLCTKADLITALSAA